MIKKSFSNLIREELVKRFESVVKDQINENEQRFKAFSKRLDELEGFLKSHDISMRDLRKSVAHLENELNKKENEFKTAIKQDQDEKTSHLKAQSNKIFSICEDMKNKIKNMLGNSEFSDFKRMINESFQKERYKTEYDVKNILKMIYELDDEMEKHRAQMNLNFEKSELICLKALESSKNELKAFLDEKDGFKREMEIVKKSIFIVEKKIENIYTLIDRIKNESSRTS